MSGPTGGFGTACVGFFGKLPGAGDFVQRRLPALFVERWDPHFEQAVHASRAALGDGWAQAWRASPLWRFVLAPQVCGEGAWAGVLGPAEDRVGRSFPMVLAAPVAPEQIEPLLREGAGWFDALARVHTEGQRGAAMGAEAFDALVAALPAPGAIAPMQVDPFAAVDFQRASHWRLPLPARAMDGTMLAALWQRLAGEGEGAAWSLWWSEGAGRVPPAILATRGLPAPEAYAGFLDAACATGWHTPAGASSAAEPALAAGGAEVPGAAVEPTRASVAPGEFDDDLTVPGHGRINGSLPSSSAQTVAASPTLQASPGTAVVRHPACALTLVAADAGTPDPRRRAATVAASAALELAAADEAAPGMHALRGRLMALHPHLRHSGMREDGAVVAARVAGGQAGLLRIGAAGAWHWRGGRLRPLFVALTTQAPLPGGGELDDLLFGGTDVVAAPGLGAEGTPSCEQIACELLPGDRLVLLAGVAHTQLSLATLAQALAAERAQDAQARLVQALGPTHSRPAPLAVIEVQP